MKAFTDYPIEELGDQPYMMALIREVDIISYDGDKYCHVKVEDIVTEIKAGYIYNEPGRLDEVTQVQLSELPHTKYDH